jgi:hypothetical protein
LRQTGVSTNKYCLRNVVLVGAELGMTLRRRGMFLLFVGARTGDDSKEKKNVPFVCGCQNW